MNDGNKWMDISFAGFRNGYAVDYANIFGKRGIRMKIKMRLLSLLLVLAMLIGIIPTVAFADEDGDGGESGRESFGSVSGMGRA